MSHTEYHGKTAEVAAPAGQVFNYLADMRNFGELMPKSVYDWQADKDSCSFSIRSLGELKIKYEKKEIPDVLICVTEYRGSDYRLVADIKPMSDTHCEVIFRFNGDMNMVTRMLAQKPIHTLLDSLAELLEKQF
jgi:hypothetical protein